MGEKWLFYGPNANLMREEDYYYVDRKKEKVALVGCHTLLIFYLLLYLWISYGGFFFWNSWLLG
jgi:hypothetical protein